MKANYIIAYGDRGVFRFGDLPDPVIRKNEVLIEVKTVSLNPVDSKVKSGEVRFLTGFKFPKIIGSDFSGIVISAGAESHGFSAGDRVYGTTSVIFRKPGALAQLVAVDHRSIRHMPQQMSFNDAAALPIAALTALNGLRKTGVTAGKEVLINGATGGVGHYAIQIARAKNASVTASCSPGNNTLAKELGADHVIDYAGEEMIKPRNKYDGILDAYGKMNFWDVGRLLKKRGSYASTLFFPPASIYAVFFGLLFNIRLTSANKRSLPGDFDEIEKLYLEGRLKPLISKIFTIEEAEEAFEYLDKGRPAGKVIVTV